MQAARPEIHIKSVSCVGFYNFPPTPKFDGQSSVPHYPDSGCGRFGVFRVAQRCRWVHFNRTDALSTNSSTVAIRRLRGWLTHMSPIALPLRALNVSDRARQFPLIGASVGCHYPNFDIFTLTCVCYFYVCLYRSDDIVHRIGMICMWEFL